MAEGPKHMTQEQALENARRAGLLGTRPVARRGSSKRPWEAQGMTISQWLNRNRTQDQGGQQA
jgi:hypothetical protein